MARSIRHGWLVFLALLSTACGPEVDGEGLTRVAIHGTREGEALEVEDDGSVELDSGVEVYAALVRVGRVTLRSDGGLVESQAPVNVDLFERTIVFDEEVGGEMIDTFSMTFPEPEADGVTPGESLCVFVAGVIEDVPFEYRDVSMEPLELSVATPISRAIDVHFELTGWFENVEERELALTGNVILIDESHNTVAARIVEAAIRASIQPISGVSLHDDDT